MKLTFKTVELQMANLWAIARGPATNIAKVIVVELTGADGTVGYGEASPIKRYKESLETVEEFLKKVDPRALSFTDIDGSMSYLETISKHDMAAKCAINVALLDGAGKKAKKPIYDMLDLGFRENAHITSFTIGIDKPDVIKRKVLEASHYPILKVKVGVDGDRDNMKALREAAPTKTVRVDANEGWKTKEHALEMIEWLAQDKNVEYIEQPMHASTPHKDWVWLKERSPLPIFADESYHTVKDIEEVAERFHGVNVKLAKSAGITGGYEALKAAKKAGLKTMIGCMIETSILINAASHLAELCDHMDVDGNILTTNDPYLGVTAVNGMLSFAAAPEKYGLRASLRK